MSYKKYLDYPVEHLPYDVKIEIRGDNVVAVDSNGNTIATSGLDDASPVFVAALNALPQDRIGRIYIAGGDYTVKQSLTLRSNTVIYNDGRITGYVGSPLLQGDSIENIWILGSGWMRQAQVAIAGQANGNFNTTPEVIRITNSKNIHIDHEVGGFSTTSATDSTPKGPSWAIYIGSSEDVVVRARSQYALEHVALVGVNHAYVELIGKYNYDSGLLILGSYDVIAKAEVDMTNVPCCANGVEINRSANVIVDAAIRNPPVYGVWLYSDASQNYELYNIHVRAVIEGGGAGIKGVELGSSTLDRNIRIDAIVKGVSGNAIMIEKASRVDINLIAENIGGDALQFYKVDTIAARIKASGVTGNALHDYARDTGEGTVSSNIRIVELSSDGGINVYPQIIEWPNKYVIFGSYTLAAGATQNLLAINANTNGYVGRVKTVRIDNSSVQVELYNATAGVSAGSTTSSGVVNWPIWSAYNYVLRLVNTDTANSQTATVMIEIETSAPLL